MSDQAPDRARHPRTLHTLLGYPVEHRYAADIGERADLTLDERHA